MGECIIGMDFGLCCEDCAKFEPIGMDGEGVCGADSPRQNVWYGYPACAAFLEKGAEADG